MLRILSLSLLFAVGTTASAADLDLHSAQTLLAHAMQYAEQHHAPGGAIAIVDAGGQLIALLRLDGSFPAAANVAIGKARTAASFRKPTRQFEELINKGRTSMLAVAAVTDFTPLQGGIPLTRDGVTVGAVGVSGADSAAQDEEIAQAAASAYATGLQP